jgi:hypothetical protein
MIVIFTTMIIATINSSKFFDATEMITETQGWVNHRFGARDQLSLMQVSLSYFKILTNL